MSSYILQCAFRKAFDFCRVSCRCIVHSLLSDKVKHAIANSVVEK